MIEERQQLGLLLFNGQAGSRGPVDVVDRCNPYPAELARHWWRIEVRTQRRRIHPTERGGEHLRVRLRALCLERERRNNDRRDQDGAHQLGLYGDSSGTPEPSALMKSLPNTSVCQRRTSGTSSISSTVRGFRRAIASSRSRGHNTPGSSSSSAATRSRTDFRAAERSSYSGSRAQRVPRANFGRSASGTAFPRAIASTMALA